MIYKFFSNTEYILSSLINYQIWFSRVEDFNDPFEWNYPYKIDVSENMDNIKKYVEDNNHGRTPHEKEIILKNYIEHPEILEKKFNESLRFRENKGVCCFTINENKLNVLMWSHYTNSHTGVVLGFLKDEMEIIHSEDYSVSSVSQKIFSKPDCREVIYDNIRPFVNPFDKNKLKVRDYEYIKSKIWYYEKEIRMVSPKCGLHFYNKHSLKEIIFGINTSERMKFTIENLINNKTDFPTVKLFKCEKEKGTLEIKLTEYK